MAIGYLGSAGLHGARQAARHAKVMWRKSLGGSVRKGTMEVFGWHFEKVAGKGGSAVVQRGFFGMGTKGGFGWSKGLGLPFTALFAYQGYQEGGLMGAAGGIMESAMWGVGQRAVTHLAGAALGSAAVSTLGVGAVFAGAAYGAYRFNQSVLQHNKRLRKSEFVASNINDPFGTIATVRRRSLQALHNSGMNGRIALGREAQLISRGMR